jgi:3-oxoadipate enol-lactonase
VERIVGRGGVQLSVEEAGEGVPVVLLHGLTATRRYVVMGSRALERSGHRVIAYDARAHGRSSPAPSPGAYGYDELSLDLDAVLDELEIERAVLAGASMGAHTLLRLALDAPQRVAALVAVTPGFDPTTADDPIRLARWDALAEGLRRGGVEGFVAAYGEPAVPERWRDTVGQVLRQRLAAHEHPDAVADALSVVPRSHPFGALEDLAAIESPVVVVASRDAADPAHPFALAEAYAHAIPGAQLLSEEEGQSPLAWQGGRLSAVIADAASTAARDGLVG